MTLLETFNPVPRAVVFDAYGTLFDVHSAVMRHAARMGPEAAAFSAHWRARQLEYTWVLSLAGRYRDFWSLTSAALDQSFAAFPQVERGLRADLLAAYRTLSAYAEVPQMLAGLKARGLRTAILSNGEPGMLADAVHGAALGPVLDAVLSVDSVCVFKTDPRTYGLVGPALGVAPADVLFVSSNRWDVAGATAFGFRCLWCNRSGAADDYVDLAPIAVVRDLEDL
jgi:2-haloacid dehalogenase